MFENCSHVAVLLNEDETKRRQGDIYVCAFADWNKVSVIGFFNPKGYDDQLLLLLNYCYCTSSLKL